MKLSWPAPPAEVSQALASSLPRLREAKFEAIRSAAESAPGGASAFTDVHQVFTLGLDQILAGSPPESGRASSWRYMAASPVGAGLAEVVRTPQGKYEVATVSEGPRSRAGTELIAWLKGIPEVEDGDFELRGLRVPALLVDAFWLKHSDPARDRFVAAAAPGGGIPPNKLLSRDEFMSALRQLATRRGGFDDSPRQLGPNR